MVQQRHHGDCGLAAIATLLERTHSYDDVHAAAALVDPMWQGTRGLRVRDLLRVARALGLELAWRRRFELDTASGILVAHGPHFTRDGHYVTVDRGLVRDPGAGVTLRWRAYQVRYAAHVTTLLELPGGRRGLRRRLAPGAVAAAA